jgi:hypothetical protein
VSSIERGSSSQSSLQQQQQQQQIQQASSSQLPAQQQQRMRGKSHSLYASSYARQRPSHGLNVMSTVGDSTANSNYATAERMRAGSQYDPAASRLTIAADARPLGVGGFGSGALSPAAAPLRARGGGLDDAPLPSVHAQRLAAEAEKARAAAQASADEKARANNKWQQELAAEAMLRKQQQMPIATAGSSSIAPVMGSGGGSAAAGVSPSSFFSSPPPAAGPTSSSLAEERSNRRAAHHGMIQPSDARFA